MAPYEEWMPDGVVSLVAHRLAVLVQGRDPMREMLIDHLNRVQPGCAGSALAGRSKDELKHLHRRLTLELSRALQDVAQAIVVARPEPLLAYARRLANSEGPGDEFEEWVRYAVKVGGPADFLEMDQLT